MTYFSIRPNHKHFPEANKWMWDYCTYLGKFTDSEGTNFDLGIHIPFKCDADIYTDISAAIVHNDEAGSYYSGGFSELEIERREQRSSVYDEKYTETLRRAKVLNLIRS